MRISDWSSDVCSSDLHAGGGARDAAVADLGRRGRIAARAISGSSAEQPAMEEGSRRAPEGITREEPGELHPDTISARLVIQRYNGCVLAGKSEQLVAQRRIVTLVAGNRPIQLQ